MNNKINFYLKSAILEIKQFLRRALLGKRKFLTSATERDALQSLLRRLAPLSTNRELIRLGPNGDGGYLIPDDLNGIEACFSPGVNFVSEFEKDCANLGMKVFLADRSVDGPATEHTLFHFTKKFIGTMSNDDFMTLDNWITSSVSETSSELLLQIDIEGFEYEVFLSATESLMQRFRIIVAEFHQLDQLWNKPYFNLASRAFDKILQTHSCVHIHPNNYSRIFKRDGICIPPIMEFTFLRNDRIISHDYHSHFPHPLDYDNTNNPPIVLPKCWYRSN